MSSSLFCLAACMESAVSRAGFTCVPTFNGPPVNNVIDKSCKLRADMFFLSVMNPSFIFFHVKRMPPNHVFCNRFAEDTGQ